ncbi:serine/threonine protein kinase [Pseudomonas sp. TE3786]
MRIVAANELQDWLSHGELLEKDSFGPKVVRLADGRLLKIMRSRRTPLVARLLPSAQRFKRNAQRLQRAGIATPLIDECLWIDREKAVSACLYQPLTGEPLDGIFRNDKTRFLALLPQLAAYIHRLHQRGIYFRSLHLGNILLTADGGFGLIDFLDMRFKRGPLGKRLVRRNFEHLRGYLERRKVEGFPWDELLAAYARASKASN